MNNQRIIIVSVIIGAILLVLLGILLFVSRKTPDGSGPLDNNRVPTVGANPTSLVPTTQVKDIDVPRDEKTYTEEILKYKVERPDFFLETYVPHNEDTFSVSSILKEEAGKGYFEFTVKSKTGSIVTARDNFVQWAGALGLTSEQINSLKIVFE